MLPLRLLNTDTTFKIARNVKHFINDLIDTSFKELSLPSVTLFDAVVLVKFT